METTNLILRFAVVFFCLKITLVTVSGGKCEVVVC